MGIAAQVAPEVRDRVFVLGVRSEPEQLKAVAGAFDTIGSQLASECLEGRRELWEHDLLRHNAAEVERLAGAVRGFLF